MPRPNLSDVPVELFEKVLEDLDIFDILHLKLVRVSPTLRALLL